ncbi:MAG: C69 family dipeptidase [Muribaculaceae bacterium]|nr:C69 family dipeptidase [Muribaculaceae bacterium]
MRRILTLAAAAMWACTAAWACTSIIVGKNASADGSVMCTYNADSFGTFRNLTYLPAGRHAKGEMRQIIDRDSRVHHGEIPEAEETYSVIGNINEWQVTIGETTYGGRPELKDTTGLIDYGTLMDLALQRAKTAREAIQVMTTLAEKYGYCSTGEVFSICDPNEAWIMEMVGCGAGSKAVAWVAVRIPDDAVCAHANQSRIRTFNQKDKKNVLFSKNCITFARQKGWFSGKDADFSFYDAYAVDNFRARRICEARVWSVFRRYEEGFGEKYLPFILGNDLSTPPMPLWIVPNRKLTVADVQEALRDHYEGTPLDMTNDPGQGLYESPYRPTPLYYEVDGKSYFNERPIATQQTAFTWIAQMRSWLPRQVGGLLWWGNDDGNMVAYTPIYCANTRQPKCYNTPGADCVTFSRDNAYWVCNWVANMVYPRYSLLFPSLKAVRDSLDNSYRAAQPAIEAQAVQLCRQNEQEAVRFLTDYSCRKGDEMIARWNQLAEYLIVKYNDMVVRTEENGKFKRTETGFKPIIEKPGIPFSTARRIAREAGDRLASPTE